MVEPCPIMPNGAEVKPLAFELNDKDREILAQTDEEFHFHTWEGLKEIIGMMTGRSGSPSY